MDGVVGPKLELDIDAIDMGVLNRVEQQFANCFKKQDANITWLRVSAGVRGQIHDNSELLLGPFSQPCQGCWQSTHMQ